LWLKIKEKNNYNKTFPQCTQNIYITRIARISIMGDIARYKLAKTYRRIHP